MYVSYEILIILTTKKFPSLINYSFPEYFIAWMIPNTLTIGKIEVINITISIRADTHKQRIYFHRHYYASCQKNS